MSGRFASLAPFLSVPAFFAVRILCAMLLLKVSALYLPVTGFSTLTQFLLLSALLNMVAIGGAQNGIIREVAAADGAAAVGRARMGAFVLWAATTCLVGVPLAALGAPVADLLIGDRQAAWAVPAIVAVAFAAGPGRSTARSSLAPGGSSPAFSHKVSAWFSGRARRWRCSSCANPYGRLSPSPPGRS